MFAQHQTALQLVAQREQRFRVRLQMRVCPFCNWLHSNEPVSCAVINRLATLGTLGLHILAKAGDLAMPRQLPSFSILGARMDQVSVGGSSGTRRRNSKCLGAVWPRAGVGTAALLQGTHPWQREIVMLFCAAMGPAPLALIAPARRCQEVEVTAKFGLGDMSVVELRPATLRVSW